MHSLSLALAYSKKTYLVSFSKYQLESKKDQAKRCQTFFVMASHSFWNNECMYNVAFIFVSSFIIYIFMLAVI